MLFRSMIRHTRSLRDWSSDVCSSDLAHRLNSSQAEDGIRDLYVTGVQTVLFRSDGWTPGARRSASPMTAAAISSGLTVFSAPCGARPTAVRVAETITASCMRNPPADPRACPPPRPPDRQRGDRRDRSPPVPSVRPVARRTRAPASMESIRRLRRE